MKQSIIAREFVSMVAPGGRLNPRAREDITRLLQSMEGKRVVVRISKFRKTRSGQQNRFYYGVVLPLTKAMMVGAGNDVSDEEVHEFLKVHVGKLTKAMHDPDGVEFTVTRSSADLDTIEWEIWMTQIRAWGANYGLVIPIPNEDFDDEPVKPVANEHGDGIVNRPQTDGGENE